MILFIATPQIKSTHSGFISFLKLNAVYFFIVRANSIKIRIPALICDQEVKKGVGVGHVTGSVITGDGPLCPPQGMIPATGDHFFELPKLLTHSACQTRPGSKQTAIGQGREEGAEGI